VRFLIAAFSAAAVQPLIFLVRVAPDLFASSDAMDGFASFLVDIAVVALAVILILGIPCYWFLWAFGRVGWSSLMIAGTLLGMLPVVFMWPRQLPGFSADDNWHGRTVTTYADGIPTSYAWMQYGETVLFFGLHGLVGALVFYATLRRLEVRGQRAAASA
jgi:hypothetical protein